MSKIMEFLKGKKTFIVAGLMCVLGLLEGLDVLVVPEWVWPVIAAAGLGALRVGTQKISEAIKEK